MERNVTNLTSKTTLDLVESLDLGDGDEDNDSLLSSLNVDLAGSGDLERAELSLEIGNVVLEVEEGLGDQRLGGIGSGAGRVGGPEDLCTGCRVKVSESVRDPRVSRGETLTLAAADWKRSEQEEEDCQRCHSM